MAPIGFWLKNQPQKIGPTFKAQKWPKSAKIGHYGPKKDINDIKKFCFLHHTSPKPSLEYGSNQFLAKKSAQKIDPTFKAQKWPKSAKIGQNGH
jgi:hypothetical protein